MTAPPEMNSGETVAIATKLDDRAPPEPVAGAGNGTGRSVSGGAERDGSGDASAATGVRRGGRTSGSRNGHSAAGHVPEAELANVRAELADARAQIAALKTSENRLTGEIGLFTQRQGFLESTLSSLGDELGSVLAERSAAELRGEELVSERDRAQAEAAESSRLLDQRLSEWNSERDEQARTREQLAEAVSNVTAELAEARAERDRLQTSADELRGLLDRQASQWHAERAALATERDALAAAIAESLAERDRLHLELAETKEQAARFGAQAAWADEQIACLVENEVAATADLAAKQSKAEALNTRIADLQAELRALVADLRQRDDQDTELKAQLGRLIGTEFGPAVGLLGVLDIIRRRVRGLEQELDRKEVERERASARLRVWEESVCGILLQRYRNTLLHIRRLRAFTK